MGALLLVLSLSLPSTATAASPLAGVNLSGAEFNPERLPGRVDTDYTYPTPDSARYFLGKGMRLFRLPVLWERLQPAHNGDLDADELERVRKTVGPLTAQGATVVIDLHNYGRYRGAALGSPALPVTALADLWRRLAPAFAGDGKVVFGLMNEPHGIPATLLRDATERAVAAIRNTGATNLVLVPGANWSGAHDFVRQGGAALQNFRDPANNFAYEMHQYLDRDYSGTNPACIPAEKAGTVLAEATAWLRANHARGFLGEFGVGPGRDCLAGLTAMLGYLTDNADVWLGWAYWAAGPWWGDYPFSIEPAEGRDRPQMDVLKKFIKSAER